MSYAIQEYQTEKEGKAAGGRHLGLFLVMGVLFGIVLTKAEVVSWFRIQEMFRFQSFHMYGVIGSAIAVAAASLWLIDRLDVAPRVGDHATLQGQRKPVSARHVGGGLLFGCGWALTGACPGPIYTLIGSGAVVMAVVLVSAVAGAWAYGHLRPRLPH